MSLTRWSAVMTVVVLVAAAAVAAAGPDRPEPAGGDTGLDLADGGGPDGGPAATPRPQRDDPPESGDRPSEVPGSGDDTGSVLRVWARPDLPDGFEDDVAALPEVTDVSTRRRGLVHLAGSWDADGAPVDEFPAGFVIPLQAAALDGGAADDHPDLGSLEPGDIALSTTSSRLRRLGPGSVVDLEGTRFTVTAVVPDAIAGSAEVLLAPADAERFGIDRRSVTIRHDGGEEALRDAIRALLPTDVTARIRGPRDGRSGLRGRSHLDMKERFGEFAHGPVRSGGAFDQDRAWVEDNIVTARVPIIGAITCHREFIPLVAGALGELEDEGLGHLVDPADHAGCWAPRRIASGRTISKHAWGAAIDINASANAYGETPTLDPRVVETFERWGMRWGGDFLVPDGMHFEWSADPEDVVDASD